MTASDVARVIIVTSRRLARSPSYHSNYKAFQSSHRYVDSSIYKHGQRIDAHSNVRTCIEQYVPRVVVSPLERSLLEKQRAPIATFFFHCV